MLPSPFARLFGMVSTSFVTANHTVNSTGKLPKNGIVIRKLSFATPGLCRLIFDYAIIEELDEAVLNRLISRILIGEVKKADGQKVQEVRIVYNFVGEIPEIAAQKLKSPPMPEGFLALSTQTSHL